MQPKMQQLLSEPLADDEADEAQEQHHGQVPHLAAGFVACTVNASACH